MDETFYDRRIAPENQPRRKSRMARLIGIEQWRSRHQRIAFHHAVMRPVLTILKLPVLISSAYYVFSFAWVIGINATTGVLLQRVYHWGPEAIGQSLLHLLYYTLLKMNHSAVLFCAYSSHSLWRTCWSLAL